MSNEAKVEYRRLGQSGLKVSIPILGGMSFGSNKWAPWVLNEDQATLLLKHAWDRGINTIDTANIYSNGESERIIGKFIKQYSIPRHKLLIFTKCFATVGDSPQNHRPDANSRDYVNQGGLSRAAIFNAVDASLARLETPYIDLLQIHRFDPNTSIDETMKALHDLVLIGKVRYIGASSMRTWQFAQMQSIADKHNWTKFVSMQNEYSLLYREEEREMIPYCNATGVGLIPWSPLHAGDLARHYDHSSKRKDAAKGSSFEKVYTKADKTTIERVGDLAQRKGWTRAQVALAWIDKKVSSPIVGVSTTQQLEEAILGHKTLNEEEVASLEEPYIPKAVRGHV